MVRSSSSYHLFPLGYLVAPLYLGSVTSSLKPSGPPPSLETGLLAFPLNTASLDHVLAAHCKRKTPARCENEHRTSKVAKIIQDATLQNKHSCTKCKTPTCKMVSHATAIHVILLTAHKTPWWEDCEPSPPLRSLLFRDNAKGHQPLGHPIPSPTQSPPSGRRLRLAIPNSPTLDPQRPALVQGPGPPHASQSQLASLTATILKGTWVA